MPRYSVNMRTERARARLVATVLGGLVLFGLLAIATTGRIVPGWLAPHMPRGPANGFASLLAPWDARTHLGTASAHVGGEGQAARVLVGRSPAQGPGLGAFGGSTGLAPTFGRVANTNALSAACAGTRSAAVPADRPIAKHGGSQDRTRDARSARAPRVEDGRRPIDPNSSPRAPVCALSGSGTALGPIRTPGAFASRIDGMDAGRDDRDGHGQPWWRPGHPVHPTHPTPWHPAHPVHGSKGRGGPHH